jgi:hypothetical protein
MIIGINGKIGSGKDTVGLIIQYLTDELNKANPKEFTEWVDGGFHTSDWKIKKFAGKLKQIASILTGATLEQLEDQDFKKLEMSPEWGITYRELLQKLGTEAMRNVIHENVWVNALMADYKHEPTGTFYNNQGGQILELPNWVITDMRFPNEMDVVKARGGITIRVNRTNRWNKPQDIEHASETALNNHEFDYVIDNNGSMSDLVDKVRTILTKEKVI